MKCFTIRYVDDNPQTAKLACPECGILMEEKHKTHLLSPENGAHWFKANPSSNKPSFKISALYSPIGFYSWSEAVELWLKQRKNFDKDLLQVFVNTVLGEGYSISGETLGASYLEKRRVKIDSEVPQGVKLLVASADVQESRIECEIVGWGRKDESWGIDYRVFLGNTEQDTVWEDLDQYLLKQWKHESGALLSPITTVIDSGYRTKKVYSFCRLREHRRVYPIKGDSDWGKKEIINRPKKRNEEGVFLFNVYVDKIKTTLYSRLKIELGEGETGKPGYCHFPKKLCYDHRYFKMLTAERLLTKRQNGFPKLVWDLPKGARNEALDVRVYAIAALEIFKPDMDLIDRNGGTLTLSPMKQKMEDVYY